MRFHFLFVLSLFAPACASNTEPSQDEQTPVQDQDLIGGKKAGERFPATVAMQLPGGRCGAAKIGERRFLTASHCVTVARATVGESITVTSAKTGSTITATIKRARHSPFNAAPEGTGGQLSERSGLDVGLLEIDQDTPDVAIAKLDRTPLRAGDKVVLSGSGCTSDALTPNAPADVVRGDFRFALLKIDSVEKYHYYLPRNDTAGKEARVCQGDSGSPLFKATSGSTYTTVVGVNSFRAPTVEIWSAAARLDTDVPANADDWLERERVFE